MPTSSLLGERNTLGIVQNGIFVFTESGFGHKFAVYGREEIMEFITAKAKKRKESNTSPHKNVPRGKTANFDLRATPFQTFSFVSGVTPFACTRFSSCILLSYPRYALKRQRRLLRTAV